MQKLFVKKSRAAYYRQYRRDRKAATAEQLERLYDRTRRDFCHACWLLSKIGLLSSREIARLFDVHMPTVGRGIALWEQKLKSAGIEAARNAESGMRLGNPHEIPRGMRADRPGYRRNLTHGLIDVQRW